MKILFLTNLLPYPLDNGGKIKANTTIKSLVSAGHQMDLVCFTESNKIDSGHESELSGECLEIHQVFLRLTTALNKKYMMRIALKSLFSKYSFGVLKYWSEDMASLLVSLLSSKKYDCIYFDHLQMFIYADIIGKYCDSSKWILDEHNCEFMIMQRRAETTGNLAKQIFFKIEARKLKRFERQALKRTSKVIVLSQEDDMILKKLSKKPVQTAIIPIGVKTPEFSINYRFDDLNTVNILFVGTLSWAPNHEGLMWYLEQVMPKMQKEYGDFRLYIVGKNPGESLVKLANKYKNIIITGYVDSVLPYYQKCDFMIVPLFVGSGQRVKIIEGFSYGMPMISTSVGAEGLHYTDGENILIANDANQFIQKCQLMKRGSLRQKLSEKARKTFEKNYSLAAVSSKICDVVGEIQGEN